MVPIPIDGSAVEPVSLAEMRAYLRLDDAAEDDLVATLVRAARLAVEASARRVLVASRWRLLLDAWPSGRTVRLPLSPLIAVERIAVLDAAGQAVDLAPALFRADAASDPPRILVDAAAPDPGLAPGGIAIDLTAGFGSAPEAIPEPLRQAVRLLAARWFENRGDAEAGGLPPDVAALVAPYRRARL